MHTYAHGLSRTQHLKLVKLGWTVIGMYHAHFVINGNKWICCTLKRQAHFKHPNGHPNGCNNSFKTHARARYVTYIVSGHIISSFWKASYMHLLQIVCFQSARKGLKLIIYAHCFLKLLLHCASFSCPLHYAKTGTILPSSPLRSSKCFRRVNCMSQQRIKVIYIDTFLCIRREQRKTQTSEVEFWTTTKIFINNIMLQGPDLYFNYTTVIIA